MFNDKREIVVSIRRNEFKENIGTREQQRFFSRGEKESNQIILERLLVAKKSPGFFLSKLERKEMEEEKIKKK